MILWLCGCVVLLGACAEPKSEIDAPKGPETAQGEQDAVVDDDTVSDQQAEADVAGQNDSGKGTNPDAQADGSDPDVAKDAGSTDGGGDGIGAKDSAVTDSHSEDALTPQCAIDTDCTPPSVPGSCQKAVCQAGACVVQTLADGDPCDDGSECTKDLCDSKGVCKHTKLDGTPCGNGNPCTLGDVCKAGVCTALQKSKCDDGNLCTIDLCPFSGGCLHTVGAACQCGKDADCSDGIACTIEKCDVKTGVCSQTLDHGQCGAPSNTLCKGKACAPGVGCTTQNKPDGKFCDWGWPGSDGMAEGMFCKNGSCSESSCSDKDTECTGWVWVMVGCQAEWVSGKCKEDDPCVVAQCEMGSCVITGPKNETQPCEDGNPCTTASACKSGKCIGVASKEGSPCPDNSACNEPGYCLGGNCKPSGKPMASCAGLKGDDCTLIACIDGVGCAKVPLKYDSECLLGGGDPCLCK